jgi:hypothetical protein
LYDTCWEPSARAKEPNLPDATPGPATGVPLVVTGGQIEAHCPEQVDVLGESDSHM